MKPLGDFVWLYKITTLIHSKNSLLLYLESSGSNGEQQSEEEEKDEGDGRVSHVIVFCIHSTAPLVVQFNQELWM